MSALQRSAMSARIAKLPQIPPEVSAAVTRHVSDDQEDEDWEENDDLGELPSSMGPPKQPSRTSIRSNTTKSEFTPVSAAEYFAQAVQVDVPSSQLSFRVYYTPPKITGSKGSIMVCHHGAGFSALSFACFAKEVERISNGECGVLAFDAREHGKTTSSGSPDIKLDLSIERLCTDLVELIKTTFSSPSEAPTFLLVGHSMGGSVIVRACGPLLEAKYRVAGVAVLDVVEGFSLEALPHMHKLLDSRPSGFSTQEDAIKWHVDTNTIRNLQSARISVPPMFVPADASSTTPAWNWRTPLRSTAPFWTNWFTGLSSKFLAARTARLLVLAGTERLDKELMIGQMQGKFQMVIVPDVGHIVHEDNPARLAEILVEFWKRNDRVVTGVKKVGEA